MRNVLSKFINDTFKLMEKHNLKDNDMRKLNDLIDIVNNQQEENKFETLKKAYEEKEFKLGNEMTDAFPSSFEDFIRNSK